MMRVVGTASRKASLSPIFCSYSDFFLIPVAGFWYSDLMTLRAATTWVLMINIIIRVSSTHNTVGRHWEKLQSKNPTSFPPVWYKSPVLLCSSVGRRTRENWLSWGEIHCKHSDCLFDLNSICLLQFLHIFLIHSDTEYCYKTWPWHR